MIELLIPLGIILAMLIGLVIYVLAIAVRQMSNQLTKMNEKLLIVVGAVNGGDGIARALVAHSKPPHKELDGISGSTGLSKKEKPKVRPGYRTGSL